MLPIRIREIRESQGLTIKALADKARLGQGYLSDLETGKRRWNCDHLEKISDALDVSPIELLPRTDEQSSTTKGQKVFFQMAELLGVMGDLPDTERERVINFAKALRTSQSSKVKR